MSAVLSQARSVTGSSPQSVPVFDFSKQDTYLPNGRGSFSLPVRSVQRSAAASRPVGSRSGASHRGILRAQRRRMLYVRGARRGGTSQRDGRRVTCAPFAIGTMSEAPIAAFTNMVRVLALVYTPIGCILTTLLTGSQMSASAPDDLHSLLWHALLSLKNCSRSACSTEVPPYPLSLTLP